jgi:hypothetical protein
LGKSTDFGRRVREAYTKLDYHKPSDEIKQDWDLSGAVDDLRVFMEVGFRAGNEPEMPAWKPGTEFQRRREEMMKRRSPASEPVAETAKASDAPGSAP